MITSQKASMEEGDLVKYMKNVPNYLGKAEKILNMGVLDWGRLQKWQNDNKSTLNNRDRSHHTDGRRRGQTLESHLVTETQSNLGMERGIPGGVKSSENSSIMTYLAAKVRSLTPARRSVTRTQAQHRAANRESYKVHRNMAAWKTTQAQVREAVTDGIHVLIFSVEGRPDILAAITQKYGCYTFFAVGRIKRELHHINPAPIAQMQTSHDGYMTREYNVLALGQNREDDLAAIVVVGSSQVTATAVLPGATHGIPAEGKPSSLLQRWNSGGKCDCGGWDLGCKLKVFAGKHTYSSARILPRVSSFSLCSQDGSSDSLRVFSLASGQEGNRAVEFSTTVSSLQAFAICIAIIDSGKLYISRNTLVDGDATA